MAWTLFSAVVGAGFATGQELLPFLRHCHSPPLAAAAACLLAGCLAWGRAVRPSPGAAAAPARAPFDPDRAGRLAAVIISWISLTAMEAALAHLLQPLLGPAVGLAAAAAAIAAGAALPAARGLGRISVLLGPFMAVAVLATAAWVALLPTRAPEPGKVLPALQLDAGRCALRMGLYAAANGLFAEAPLRAVAAGLQPAPAGPVNAPPAAGPRPGALWPGLWGGGLLGATAGVAIWVVDRTASATEPMPLVVSAARVHPSASVLYGAVVTASAYTTAVAAAVGLAGASPAGRAGPEAARLSAARAVAWTLLAAPPAAAGFAETVQRLYPLAGWMALGAVALQAAFAAGRRWGLY